MNGHTYIDRRLRQDRIHGYFNLPGHGKRPRLLYSLKSNISETRGAFCRDTVISAVDTRDYFLQEIDAIYKECIVTSDFSLVGVAAESASAPINEERNGAMGNRPSLLACALAAVSLILTAVSVTQGLLLAATVSGFLAGFQCGLILAVFLVKKVMAEGKGILN